MPLLIEDIQHPTGNVAVHHQVTVLTTRIPIDEFQPGTFTKFVSCFKCIKNHNNLANYSTWMQIANKANTKSNPVDWLRDKLKHHRPMECKTNGTCKKLKSSLSETSMSQLQTLVKITPVKQRNMILRNFL